MIAQGDDQLGGRMLHRMMFFTDAVFAIVLTLLVLELKPPEGRLEATRETLAHAWPHIAAFAFSFVIISVFWAAHMNSTRPLTRFDWPTAWCNLLVLLPVCMLPYATAWLGADFAGAFAWTLYSWVLVAISAASVIMVLVAFRGGGRLVDGGADRRELSYRILRAAAPGLAFGFGLILVAAGQVILAHFCWALIPLIFLLAGLLRRRRAQDGAATAPA